MAFKQFPSCHCHSAASLDTASTPEAFAKWEAAHESGALTVTDHGTLGGARKIYDIAYGKKYKGKLTPILGLEGYFRDDDCPILNQYGIPKTTWYRNPETRYMIDSEKYEKLKDEEGKKKYEPFSTLIDYQKYYHLTMHFRDQQSYETAVRLLSFADGRAEKHGAEYKPMFGWKELEEIGAQNTTFMSSCLIGMIQRHVAFGGRYDIAETYYQKLRSLVRPGNFFVEVFPHVCDRNWTSEILVTFEDGSVEKFPTYRVLKTDKKYGDKDNGIKAEKLVDAWARSKADHGSLRAVKYNRQFQEVENPKKITNVKLNEGFIMNECSTFSPNGDLQEPCNRFVIEMARKYGDKIVISDDSHFVSPDEKIVQDIKLMQDGAWRFHTSYHRLTSDEAWKYFRDVMKVPQGEFEGWIDNSREWADGFKGFKFAARKSLPTNFYPKDTLQHTMSLFQKHGRAACLRNPVYFDRLQREVNLLYYNGTIDLLPYFFIDEEVCDLYQQNGLLTGPGRGSAAGLLLSYLLEITHVDPLKYGLSMDRFLTPDRIASGKMPDIDQDLPHRDLLVNPDEPTKGWLFDRFGDCVAQISTDMTVKLKSAVLDYHRVMSADRRVPDDVAYLAHNFPQAPQGVSDRDFVFGYDNNGIWEEGAIKSDEFIMKYVSQYPKEWEVVQKCLGVPKGKSRHACAFVIADEPIYNFIPLTSINGYKVTQPTAAQVESSGGLKMDFLVVNSLKDIGVAIRLIQERSKDTSLDWNKLGEGTIIDGKKVPLHRVIPHKGKYIDIWDLPEDQAAFRSICEGDTESVFQFGTPGAVKWLKHFNHERFTDASGEVHKALDSIETLAAFTALDRPGPLDAYVHNPETENDHNMLVEFARRARGEKPLGAFPILQKLFPETYGVIVYQEQVQKAFHEIGSTTAIQANDFRIHVSKKQVMEIIEDKKVFMPGAIAKIGEEAAEQLWQSMETFGSYAFNKSHAVCYVVIGYACAWLKQHYPLEWWTAVLRHAKKDELDEKFWRHCGHLIDMPDISLSGDVFQIVNNRIRAPLNMLHGLGPAAHAEISKYRPVKTIEEFLAKIETRRRAEGTTVVKQLKTKTKTEIKRARSALHTGVMTTMIVSGAMDSLFPEGLTLLDKLEMFVKMNANITGKINKRTGQPLKEMEVDPKWKSLNDLQQIQAKKKVLPAFSTNYLQVCVNIGIEGIKKVGGQWRFDYKNEWLSIVSPESLNYANSIVPWPRQQSMNVAVVAYIMEHENKAFRQDPSKTRALLSFDVNGTRFKQFVKWPNRETGKLPPLFCEDLTGSLAIIVLNKYSEKNFSIDDVVILQEPLSDAKAEESAPTPEGQE
jgi:DNA polymerase III alpha subunit